MDNIQRIKEKLQELVIKSNHERSEENNPNHSDGFGMYWSGFCSCLKEIIPFVDSLPEESDEWTDEDINMIDWLIRCCEKEHEELCNDRYGHQEIVSDLKRDCRKKWNWLESLKGKVAPQKQWKPSEEQMKAIVDALSLAKNCGEESSFDLRTLYEQLKKLL